MVGNDIMGVGEKLSDLSELRGSPRGQFRLNEPTLRRLSHAGGVHDKSEFVGVSDGNY